MSRNNEPGVGVQFRQETSDRVAEAFARNIPMALAPEIAVKASGVVIDNFRLSLQKAVEEFLTNGSNSRYDSVDSFLEFLEHFLDGVSAEKGGGDFDIQKIKPELMRKIREIVGARRIKNFA